MMKPKLLKILSLLLLKRPVEMQSKLKISENYVRTDEVETLSLAFVLIS